MIQLGLNLSTSWPAPWLDRELTQGRWEEGLSKAMSVHLLAGKGLYERAQVSTMYVSLVPGPQDLVSVCFSSMSGLLLCSCS